MGFKQIRGKPLKFLGAGFKHVQGDPLCHKYIAPPKVDRIWGIWGSYYDMLEAIFYLLKGDYEPRVLGFKV